jgi:hypothetical protein
MNTLALEKIIEQVKALESLCFTQHRDAEHPENCKWGVAWKSMQLAREEIEAIKGKPSKPADYYVPPSRIISMQRPAASPVPLVPWRDYGNPRQG